MSQENQTEDQNNNDQTTSTQTSQNTSSTTVDVDKIVADKVAEALKDIKSKLDNAYTARDEAMKRVSEFEEKEKAERLKKLEEEGKHREVYEHNLAERDAKIKALEAKNLELTRDAMVQHALSGLEFRNERASGIAFKEIVSDLVQDANGNWVHKSGVSISDFVKAFANDDAQSFLFKPKASSGGGSTSTSSTSSSSSGKKSLFEMSQEEVLKLASEGKLRK